MIQLASTNLANRAKSRTSTSRIGDLVDDVHTWNPSTDAADCEIDYIDIGSVNQSAKQIIARPKIAAIDAPSRARQLVKAGDVLVSTVRPNLNSVALVPYHLDGATASTGFCVLRPKKEKLSTCYLFQWVKTPNFVSAMAKLATGQSYPAVSDRIILESHIPIPPLPEQQRIAAVLDAADALRQKRRQALALLDQLSQSIFIEMFGDPVTNEKQWPITTIEKLLESASYGTSAKAGAEGAWPVLRMNNLTYDGKIDLGDLKYMDLSDDEVDRYTVRSGDILFNRTNSAELVGKTAVFRGAEPMAYAGYLVRLRAGSEAVPDYISSFLNSRYGKAVLRGMCKSIIGMANINATEVQKIRIPKPPTELQSQFAIRLAEIRKVRTRFQESDAELASLFSSLQNRAFRGEL